MRVTKWVLLIAAIMLLALPVIAQETELDEFQLPEPTIVEIEAADGLTLFGDWYAVDLARPTVLLLHELYTVRGDWEPLTVKLVEAGYNVLAVDLRGWGQTRGALNWTQAVDDTVLWLVWLRDTAGVRPDAIHTMGSSMGSSLAIIGCAADELCRSAIAVSPGWSYYRLSVEDSLTQNPILAIYAERDRWPALGVPRMIEAAPDSVTVYAYEGNAHGMQMIGLEFDTFVPLVLDWLATHSE